jgi:serine/threonine-protein kinase PRP4
MDKDETVNEKDDNDSNSMDNEETENKLDSSDVFAGEADFTVVRSPAKGAVSSHAEAFINVGTTGVSGLGEGTPKVISFSSPATYFM